MANTSIFAAFERMWQHIAAALGSKADVNHTHAISNISNLQTTLDEKATQTSLNTHDSNTTKHITSTERTNWNAAKTHANSTHAPTNAEKNQNAFSNIAISGQTTVAADAPTDTVTFVGSNVNITTDANNDKITFTVANGTTSAKGIVQLTDSTSSTSTTTAATPNSVKSAYDLANTAKTNASTAQTKADDAYTLAESKVDSLSDLGITVTSTELNYVDGVTSNIQTQLDSKAESGHTHNYAGSSSAGGAATSAVKLSSSAGSTTQPIYFSNGKPVATTYALNKTVPSNAVFTDTHYTSKNVVGTTSATSNTSTALTNGNVYLNSVENGAVTSTHKISGSGATTVTTDTSGNIIISSTDNNTTYSAAGSSLGLVKSGGDVTISSGVITVNDDSHNHTIENVDNLQSSLDAKQATITGAATTITSSNLTANRALVSNASGKVAVSTATLTELNYLTGATSNIQTQIDSHTHDEYLESSSPIATGSFRCGTATSATGTNAVAVGYSVSANANYSAAIGKNLNALQSQFVVGHYNADETNGGTAGTNGVAFIIGNGASSTSKSNAFKVAYNGDVTCNSVISSGGDYAEYFEWSDGNPDNEDRRGYFVTFDGMKIRKANPNDYILGIISGQPSVLGNGDDGWKHRYMRDEFCSYIYEEVEYEEEELDEETGETRTVIKTCKVRKENPDYDPTRAYTSRADRPEWDAVGMLGVLSVRDDGTCEVNGYCQVTDGGIATKSDTGYRVISRVTENVVKVLFK